MLALPAPCPICAVQIMSAFTVKDALVLEIAALADGGMSMRASVETPNGGAYEFVAVTHDATRCGWMRELHVGARVALAGYPYPIQSVKRDRWEMALGLDEKATV